MYLYFKSKHQAADGEAEGLFVEDKLDSYDDDLYIAIRDDSYASIFMNEAQGRALRDHLISLYGAPTDDRPFTMVEEV